MVISANFPFFRIREKPTTKHPKENSSNLDRNENGGGILVFIRKDIPTKQIESQMEIGGFFIELDLRRKKWLLCCSYINHK